MANINQTETFQYTHYTYCHPPGVDGTLSEVKFSERQSKLRKQTKKINEGTIPFATTYHPAVKKLKQLLIEWSLIHNQPMLKNIYKTPPIISYTRGKSLKDILVRAKL